MSSRAMVGVTDLPPRLIGGGVAPSESADCAELAVSGDDRAVLRSLRTLAAVSGLDPILSGAGVAEDCAGAGDSLSSSWSGAEDRAG